MTKAGTEEERRGQVPWCLTGQGKGSELHHRYDGQPLESLKAFHLKGDGVSLHLERHLQMVHREHPKGI